MKKPKLHSTPQQPKSSVNFSPAQQARVEALLDQRLERLAKARAKKVALALAKHEQRRDSHGRFLRNGKITKRPYSATTRHISVPQHLYDQIRQEALDANYEISKMIVVLAQLGLPVWQQFRADLLTEGETYQVPKLVQAIVNASWAKKVPSLIHKKWHQDVDLALEKLAKQAKADKDKQKLSPTQRALQQFQGNP